MRTIQIEDFHDWRSTARYLITKNVSPNALRLLENDGQQVLFANAIESDPNTTKSFTFRVPGNFISLAKSVSFHRDADRWNLLYRVLWRIRNEGRSLLEIETDKDVYRLTRMEKQVRRDAHKMKAFVRFRKIESNDEEFYVAWHQPDHRILRRVAPFFSRRFAAMNWSILTPDESVTWDQKKLHYGKGVARSDAPEFDELEDLWRTYYANIFNPARIKIKMMKSEMAVRYWKNLPEAEIIDDLISNAPRRVEQMIEQHEGFQQTAVDFITRIESERLTLPSLRQMATVCEACDLYQEANQTVFGEGPTNAKIVLLGEQPGDEEDIQGRPFVGPAGMILDNALCRWIGSDKVIRDERRKTLQAHFEQLIFDQTKGQKTTAPKAQCPRNSLLPSVV